MKKLLSLQLFLLALFLGSASFAQLKPGVYANEDIRVDIKTTNHYGIYQVSAFNIYTRHSDSFFVNSFNWKVFKSPDGIDAIDDPQNPKVRKFEITRDDINNDGVIALQWRSGGFLSGHDESIAMFIHSDGTLLQIDVYNQISRWKLSSGLHSLSKIPVTNLQCQRQLSRIGELFEFSRSRESQL